MNKHNLVAIFFALFIGNAMHGISVSKKGYDKMIKNVTCFHITLKNSTSYVAQVNGNQSIKPNQNIIIFEQCLNEYDRLARQLGHMMEEPIKIVVSVQGKEYSVPVGVKTLENNYAFNIIQTIQGIEIREDTPTTNERPTASMIDKTEIVSPGGPEEIIE